MVVSDRPPGAVFGKMPYPLLRMIPGGASTTVQIARGMLQASFDSTQCGVFRGRDINQLAADYQQAVKGVNSNPTAPEPPKRSWPAQPRPKA